MADEITAFPARMGTREAAEKIGTTMRQIRKLAGAGLIEYVQVGERMTFTQSALSRYMQQATVPALVAKQANHDI